MTDLLAPAVIAGLLAINAAFVAAEFAVVAAPRAAIDHLAAEGRRSARLAARILHVPRRLDRAIATAQLGVTGASLGLGMCGEQALAQIFLRHLPAGSLLAAHGLASLLAVALLTVLHIVLGEMVPKALALADAERALLSTIWFLRGCYLLAMPLVVTVHAVTGGLLRLVGVDRSANCGGQYHSAEELEIVVRESQAGGLLELASGDMLRELFDFGDLSAGEVMAPRTQIVGLEVGSGPAAVRAVLAAAPHTRYPVYADDLDHILGFLHVKQLLPLLLAGRAVAPGDARPLPFVPETAPLDTVLDAMRRAGSQMAIVMDEFGGTAGLVSTDDLAAEIIGEIAAGKTGPLDIDQTPGGELLVAGTARLDDLGEELALSLEHDDVDTVSGLVLMLLNRPPVLGDRVAYRGLEFEVVEVEGLGVGRCRVKAQAD
jgi:CBS domain containing-hemolysin-like protein